MEARRGIVLAEVRVLAHEQADVVIIVAGAEILEIGLLVMVMAGV